MPRVIYAPAAENDLVEIYVVFYRAIEDGIEVARIVHGSRDLGNS